MAEEQEDIGRVRMVRKEDGEQWGIVNERLGGLQLRVQCQDGELRIIRIPGKMRKRVWVREGDLVIVKLWDFQPSKGDLAWRYLPNQANYLKRKGLLEGLHYDK